MTADGERLARLERALAEAEETCARDPNSVDALFERARIQSLLGEDDAAKDSYVALLGRDPTHFGALTNLAALALASGHRSAALTAYRQAADTHPANPVALVNLANLLVDTGSVEEARTYCDCVLQIDPDHAEAHRVLARALAELGEDDKAEPHWRKAFADRSIVERPFRGRGTAPRVLLLVSVKSGNIPTQLLLDDRMFGVTAIYAEYFDAKSALPPHDVVFNAIGDADLCPAGLIAAHEIVARSKALIINHPDAVSKTGRDENAKRLGALDGVIAPRVKTVSRSELSSGGGPEQLTRDGFQFPLLLRAAGFHTGRHFARVERAAELADSAAQLPGESLFVMQYLDARGDDGLARKYRVMIVDGKFYPVHLAASRDWKVHYFTSDMAAKPELRKEEERFLTAMPEVLGAHAMRALAHIRDCLGLDYCGVDFALSSEGDLLLFEANATMTILPPDQNPIWDYRRSAIARVLEAARQLVRDRATGS